MVAASTAFSTAVVGEALDILLADLVGRVGVGEGVLQAAQQGPDQAPHQVGLLGDGGLRWSGCRWRPATRCRRRDHAQLLALGRQADGLVVAVDHHGVHLAGGQAGTWLKPMASSHVARRDICGAQQRAQAESWRPPAAACRCACRGARACRARVWHDGDRELLEPGDTYTTGSTWARASSTCSATTANGSSPARRARTPSSERKSRMNPSARRQAAFFDGHERAHTHAAEAHRRPDVRSAARSAYRSRPGADVGSDVGAGVGVVLWKAARRRRVGGQLCFIRTSFKKSEHERWKDQTFILPPLILHPSITVAAQQNA